MNKIYKILLLSLILSTIMQIVSAKNNTLYNTHTLTTPSIEWEKNIGSGIGHSIQQTADGGYIIAGSTEWAGIQNRTDALLIKTDSLGNKQWSKTFGGTGSDDAKSVYVTNDGGYIIAGSTYGTGGSDVWLIKTDSLGNKQWSKTFGGTGMDDAYS